MDTRTLTAHDLARRSLLLMEQWDDTEAAAIIHPDAANDEAISEPPGARGRGPAAFKATYDWLHAAFEGLRWEVQDLVAEGDLAAARTIMRGRQVAPFATYSPRGQLAQVFASNGRSFAATQTHWYRLAEGRIIAHAADRDDLGQARQLGWVPPSPAFLVRSALAKRHLSGSTAGPPDRPNGQARKPRLVAPDHQR
jgi:predicted ester cyclase